MWDPYDPVVHRVGFFERVERAGKTFIVPKPFYMVTYPGLGGRVFEPVDCLTRRQMGGGTESTTSQKAQKQVNEIREFDGKAKLFICGKSPDGTEVTLHGFGWGWPY